MLGLVQSCHTHAHPGIHTMKLITDRVRVRARTPIPKDMISEKCVRIRMIVPDTVERDANTATGINQSLWWTHT